VYNKIAISDYPAPALAVFRPYILISHNNRIIISEISVYLNTGKLAITASDIGFSTSYPGVPETNAIDGNLNTYFESYDQDNQFFGVMLPLNANVTNITVSTAQDSNSIDFVGATVALVTSTTYTKLTITTDYKSFVFSYVNGRLTGISIPGSKDTFKIIQTTDATFNNVLYMYRVFLAIGYLYNDAYNPNLYKVDNGTVRSMTLDVYAMNGFGEIKSIPSSCAEFLSGIATGTPITATGVIKPFYMIILVVWFI
jgi:hypothetical protein